MESRISNDTYYVCSLIEFTARLTKNKNANIVIMIGKDELARQLRLASVNHCLSFEEVSDELITKFNIPQGDFDVVLNCRYKVPTHTQIGGVYRYLIFDIQAEHGGELVDIMFDVFTSFISEKISNFNSSLFYENPSYIYHSYLAGELLE